MTSSRHAAFTDHRIIPLPSAIRFVMVVSSVCWLMWLSGCQQKKQEPALPARILGGSMAPSLPGDHYRCRCEDCQFAWDFDFASAPKQYAVCPNCGFDKNVVANATRRAARRVEVTSTKHGTGKTWKRWDVVAFHHPEKPDEFGVKRIVGLPHERCEIKGGDILINGELLRKTYLEQRRLAVLVFDNQFRATSQNEFARWKRQRLPTGWRNQDGELTYSSRGTDKPPEFDWLDYQHIRGYLGLGSPRDFDVIEDTYSYNQTKVRTLNRVRDLAIDLQIDGICQGTFSVQFNHLTKPVRVEFNAGGKSGQQSAARGIRIYSGEGLLIALPWPSDFGSQTSIFLSVFDGQILLTVNQQTVASLACDLPLAEQPTISPISIGAEDAQFKLRRLQIYRDIFYLDKYGQDEKWSSGGDGFVLLGDNAPISVDSRQWGKARLPADSIVGKVTEFDE